MIKLLRVDERFIHGQVAFAWSNSLGINCILIANDEVAGNKFQQKMLKMAAPTGVKFAAKTIEEAIELLHGEKIKKYDVFVIVNTVYDAMKLGLEVEEVKQINLGNIKKKEGREPITSSVFLDAEEKQCVQKLAEAGIWVECRAVPTDKPVNPLKSSEGKDND
ncbi:PTS sugar transporter subunit IIB [Enterococcus massiliensis]|uniref:PTS sugar transporter subunit IIB n=1 Tax=Enterococcus massiliensis TaxID=1640685 RepID=UPI00065DC7DF|nr:PTS sugar transporter subunit IIB [Enterococcus massiliensis]